MDWNLCCYSGHSKHRFPMPMLPKRRIGNEVGYKSEPYLRTQGTKAGFALS